MQLSLAKAISEKADSCLCPPYLPTVESCQYAKYFSKGESGGLSSIIITNHMWLIFLKYFFKVSLAKVKMNRNAWVQV